MRNNLIVLILLILTAAIACTNCLCVDYFRPPMQWYNHSYIPEPDVTIGVIAYTLGPQPITIRESDSGRINISTRTYSHCQPRIYRFQNDGRLNISFWLSGSSDVQPGIKSDTYVDLPRGSNYTVIISNRGSYPEESQVVSEYGGVNLTLWVNNPDHDPYEFYNQNYNLFGYREPDWLYES